MRSSWKSIWMNLCPREEWPRGAGYEMSGFEIGRQYPDSPELNWQTIAPVDANTNPNGACNVPWNQAYAGELEKKHKPAVIGMIGPTVCADDLTHKWESPRFWSEYYDQMQKFATMIPINRLGTVYMHYSWKLACKKNAVWTPGKATVSQPPPANTDMTDFLVGGICGPPASYLTLEYLRQAHYALCDEGAMEGDVSQWINFVNGGPIWPVLIGQEAWQSIWTNNPELRADYNAGFMGLKEMNPVLTRLGATQIVSNFRNVIDLHPRRYIYVPWGTTVNLTSTGTTSSTNVVNTYANTDAGALTNPSWSTPVVHGQDQIVNIPDHVRSTNSADVTKGQSSVTNGCYVDPNVTVVGGSSTGVMQIETCCILNPLVLTEHVVLPTNSMPGMKLEPQNYMGQWKYVVGPDAFNGIAGCTVVADPLHKLGRHFGEYRASWEAVHPIFGRVIAFQRCPAALDEVGCS